MSKKFVSLVAFAALLLLCQPEALAQKAVWEEYDKLIQSKSAVGAMGPDLFGDQVSYYTGGLSFSATDVGVPGNNALPVAVARSLAVSNRKGHPTNDLAFADWDMDLPNIGGVFASSGWKSGSYSQPDNRCSANPSPPDVQVGTNWFYAKEYWQGHQLSLPGGGGGEVLVRNGTAGAAPTSGGPYPWVTSGWTYLSCLSEIKNGTGEGFLAITADGTKYWFDWMVSFGEPYLRKPKVGGATGDDILGRKRFVLYATRVEDRLGNWVKYTYTSGSPSRLSRIESSDGRLVTVDAYTAQGFVSQVSANGRTWTYQYDTTDPTRPTLRTVILPDTSRWTINFPFSDTAIRYYQGEPGESWRDCLNPGDVVETSYTGTITHPSGAVGEFSVSPTRFTRGGVPDICHSGPVGGNTSDDVAEYPSAWDSYALTKKRVSGPALTPAEWNYSYFAGTVEITEPGNTYSRYTFGTGYKTSEGKLLKVEEGASPTDIRKVESYAYDLGTTRKVGTSPQLRNDAYTSEYLLPRTSRVVTQDGATFSSNVASTCNGNNTLCVDAFARPLSEVKQSSLNPGKTDTAEYYDDLSKWVLSQVKRTTTDGIEVGRTDYDASTALPIKSYAFGKLQQTLTYALTPNTDQTGTVSTIKDGNNNVTTLSSWKRGIPQSIRHPATAESPAGATESAVVNDDGSLASRTDESGNKTCYGYDAIGRLNSITYPSETSLGVCDTAEADWNKTTQIFETINAVEYGIPAGHWKQTVSTGNGRKVTYFDGLWRPLVQESYDNATPATTRSVTVMRYDAGGHLVFQSYPLASLTDYAATILKGAVTSYDTLDRVVEVRQNWENDASGLLTTKTEYLSGFQTRVTNPRGFATTTSYKAYDQPSRDWPVAITHPEGAYTYITRDTFGKPIYFKRRDAANVIALTRSYAYDTYQRLCRSAEPESLGTLVGYDDAGNLAWSAAGLPTTTACDPEGDTPEILARRVSRTYDTRNRVTSLVFPDGRGDQAFTYTPDGLVAQITTYNGANQTVPVINAYHYNHRRMLDGQGESISQPNWYTWGIGYGYNANGHLASHVYPENLTITYLPNALGQPTQVGTYAEDVSYYPNGAVKQFTYGNGIVHTLTQNVRALPEVSRDASGSTEFLDDGYDFDANGNVAAISDGLTGARGNRTMTYDGLDRLTSTVSPMFSASPSSTATYSYDVLDNLTRAVAPGRDHYYCYDASWRLTLIKVGSCSGAAVIGMGYDVQGNVNNKNGQTFDFDYGNRLRAVINKEGYVYDGHGRRVQASAPGLGYILSQYGQDGLLRFQHDGRRQLALGYIYLAGSLIAIREMPYGTSTHVTKYQHTDALGSPVAVTDANRNLLERNEYEPYGKVLVPTTPNDGPGYTGHVFDAATGLNYMQQRYYDPGIGRFLSVDPVSADSSTGGNFNRYKYAANNPYLYTDPDGRKEGPGGAGAAYIGNSINGIDVNSAESIGMANIPKSWSQQPQVTLGQMQVADSSPREPLYCSGGADCDFMYNQQEFLSGNIGDGEFSDRTVAQGKGGMIGAVISLTAIGAAEYAPALAASVSAFGAYLRRNVSFEGPSPGLAYANGKIVGATFFRKYNVRLDYHPLQGSGRTPILHINYGPSGRGEAGHIKLWDPRWYTYDPRK